MRLARSLLVFVAMAALVVPAVAAAHSTAKVTYEDTLPKTGVGQVTLTTRKAASFRVVLRVPTQGRARLYLLGAKAPQGGPLIDTRTGGCEGAAGSFYCRGSYEPLPAGTYTFRIRWSGAMQAPVTLTVRW